MSGGLPTRLFAPICASLYRPEYWPYVACTMWLPFPSTSHATATLGTMRLLSMLCMSPGVDSTLTCS